MSHNPNRGVGNRTHNRFKRKYDPSKGYRRTGAQNPQGVDLADIQNREVTGRGWKILYFQGEDYEMVYELIANGNSTGIVKNDKADRSVRVLEGQLYVLMDGEIITVSRGQSFSFPRGTEYEISAPSTSDVEVLFCQSRDYDQGVTQISEAQVLSKEPKMSVPNPAVESSRVDKVPAQKAAVKIRDEKMRRQRARNPVPKKNADGSPAGHGRAPLVGQQVSGTSPKPVGPGGYAE